jgi:hypothetical protein
MKQSLSIALLGVLLGLAMPSHAQQCGYGVQDGGQCVPADQVPGYQDSLQDNQARPTQQPRAVWADRWGAIASDKDTASIGVSENQTSKAAAKAEALQRCASQSNSQHCEVELAYYNQCAALAWGTKFSDIGHAQTQAQAQNEALSGCAKEGVSNCKIVYSACSLPVRVH